MAKIFKNRTPAPTLHPSMLDIAWAAGIFEGEGSIRRVNPKHQAAKISVTQKDPFILYKMRELFGGTVRIQHKNNKSEPYYCWDLSGARGRGFAYTIYSFLSPRRCEQVKIALSGAR